jgi:uncharacterized protein (TIGR02594 family)
MHRRFTAVALAASSLVAVALAAPEVAQSKPLRGQQAEAQNTRSHKSTKIRSKRTTRPAEHIRAGGRAGRTVSRRSRHVSRASAARSQTQTSNPYADDRFNYGPLTAAAPRNAERRHVRRSAPRAEVARTTSVYQDERFNYGPRIAVTERKTSRRRAGRSAPRAEVGWNSNPHQDDRFNYGPRTATVRSADRHRSRDAMARAYPPSRDRDGSDDDGPRFAAARSSRFGFGSADVVSEARRYIGSNPTDRRSLWCARFMNYVLERSGYQGTGSDKASSFARYGRRVSGPQIGAIAVMSRGRRGGHVGVVSGIDENGNPIIISGNHGNEVAEAPYPRGVIYAYVMPH